MSDVICENPQNQSFLNRASKDKFLMILELPFVMRNNSSINDFYPDIESLQISVYGTVVPDIIVPEIDVRYAGQNLHLSTYTRPNYPPLTINFVVDNEYKNYFLLWKWLEIMNLPLDDKYGGSQTQSREDAYLLGSNFEYQTDFSILALNEYNEVALEFKYYKAFISSLGSINYSYRDGEILESSAQFHFSQFNIEKPRISTNVVTPLSKK